jgi:predicted O-methyltransferase YrrM
MNRQVKEMGKKVLGAVHRTALRTGFVVLPDHYYTPVANIIDLKESRGKWAKRSSMVGIDIDIDRQASRLMDTVMPFEAEYRGNAAFKKGQSNGFGPGFGYIEAQCLHGLLRSLKPKRIIEVGSGVSTYCATRAIALNAAEGHPAEIFCVEPNPSPFLRNSSDIKLLSCKVEELQPAEFERLQPGDFLFIDTSHAVKPGGDVIYLYLEIIPRLQRGCVVHIHDIYFPYAYQRDLLDTLFQQSETALLQALLTNNARLRIIFSLSMLHYDAPDVLKKVFPEYSPAPDSNGLAAADTPGHFPSSIYLETL